MKEQTQAKLKQLEWFLYGAGIGILISGGIASRNPTLFDWAWAMGLGLIILGYVVYAVLARLQRRADESKSDH
jgi:hypothetical protein